MAISPAESSSHDTEALYREHGAAVSALCGSLLRDRTETEDATQQVFLSAHRALLNGATPREPRAWLLAVARHECYARFRERASTPTPSGDAPEVATADASVHVLRAGELDNVWDEVGRMPATQREAFLLREIRGLTYGQVADELSLSRPSVRSLLLRARRRLRARLGDVAAGFGGVPWIQALLRIGAAGDVASPVPAATKAAAVGIGALALAGGGGLVARHAAQAPHRAARHHQGAAHVHHVATPPVIAATPREVDRPGIDDRGSEVERSQGRHDASRESGEHGGRGRDSRSSRRSSGPSGRDSSGDTAVVAESSTDGSGSSSGGSSSGPGPSDSSSSGSGDHGSDGGSGSLTTATPSGSDSGSSSSSGSDGSGSSGSSGSDDSGGSGSSDGSSGGTGSDGGGGHDG